MNEAERVAWEWRFYTGVVAIQVANPGEIEQHNEVWSMWARSEAEALGHAVEQTQKKHPRGHIVYSGMSDITDAIKDHPLGQSVATIEGAR